MAFPSVEEKYRTVIEKNTFYFYDREFEETFMKDTLIHSRKFYLY